MSPTKPLLTRKDIAAMLVDVTPDQVRQNEKRWGFDKARADLNKRNVRYKALIVLTIMRQKGWLQ